MRALFAELAADDEADDELPPSSEMKGSSGIPGERRHDGRSSSLPALAG